MASATKRTPLRDQIAQAKRAADAKVIATVAESAADIAWNDGAAPGWRPSGDDFVMLDLELGRKATALECETFSNIASSYLNFLCRSGQ